MADLTQLSKFLSFVLRHQPESIGLDMDAQGWVGVEELILKSTKHRLTPALIRVLVETSDKQRFALSADGSRIRANQGHSIELHLDLAPQVPPAQLFHCTAQRFLAAIQAEGILKRDRHHVHLSSDVAVAESVGQRHGKPVILVVAAERMAAEGFLFYLSANGVWLTDSVPPAYFSVL